VPVNTVVRYALRAMIAVADGQVAGPLRAQDIAAGERISAKYLERILGRLVQAGLVVALRGPGGGYVLARSAAEITLQQIVGAAGGGLVSVPCLGPDCEKSCELAAACRARPVWSELHRLTDGFLTATTLAAICSGRGRKRIAPLRSSAVRKEPLRR